MPDKRLPTVGAALPIKKLVDHRDWLLEGQRDLEIQDAFMPDVLDGDWRALVRQARDVLDRYTGRLGIHGPFDGLPLMSRDAKVRALVTQRLWQGLEFGAELGASHMVVHSPFNFFGDPFSPHAAGKQREEQIALVRAVLDEIVPLAQQAQCTLVIENIYDLNSAPLLDLVRSFNSEHVRMSLDTGHAYLTHRRGGPTPDQWAREAGPLLGHLHLQDTDGCADRHWLPGSGNVNWNALFTALGELQHRPRLIIEIIDVDRVQEAAGWFVQRGLAQ